MTTTQAVPSPTPALGVAEVSAATGLSEHTLRYYERAGLLDPVPRRSNGQRRYGDAELSRIEFVTKMRRTGMPIRVLRRYLAADGDTVTGRAERRAILVEHRTAMLRRLQECRDALELAEYKITLYDAGEMRKHS